MRGRQHLIVMKSDADSTSVAFKSSGLALILHCVSADE